MYAVSEADWGRESLKAFAFLVNTGKDGTFSLPQSLRDSSLIRGSLVRSQQPSEHKRSFLFSARHVTRKIRQSRPSFLRRAGFWDAAENIMLVEIRPWGLFWPCGASLPALPAVPRSGQ